MVQILCHTLPEFPFPLSGHRGKEDKLFWVSHLQGRRCDFPNPASTCSAYLIHLCQDDQMRNGRRVQPCTHLLIEGGGWMASVHNHHDCPERLSVAQISFHHCCPGPPHLLRNSGIPISRKVNKIEGPVDTVKIDRLGPSGSFGDPGELSPAEEPIEQGRFAHIRPADKGDLGPTVLGKVPWTCRAAYKFRRGNLHPPGGKFCSG